MGDERGDDAPDERRAYDYASARIGAAAALTIVLVVLLIAEYLARMARLRGELEIVGAQPARDLPARRATEWLDALAETWQQTGLVEEKSDVIHAIYERIVIEGPRFVGLRLTPAAYRHGMALALPEAVMARPTGFEPATFGSGGRRNPAGRHDKS